MPDARLAKCRALYQELNRELPPVNEGEIVPPIQSVKMRFIGSYIVPDAEASRRLREYHETGVYPVLEPDADTPWAI